MKHFIIDFETFSQNQLSAAVAIAAYMIFDWDRFTSEDPYTPEELLSSVQMTKFELSHQRKTYGYKTEKETLEWWLKQPKEVQWQGIPDPKKDVTLEQFNDIICDYVKGSKIAKWWSRGGDFDPVLLKRITDSIGDRKLYETLKYWDHEDTRSFIDGFTFFDARNDFIPIENEEKWKEIFIQHRADHDVMADVLRLQTITRIRNGL